MDIRVQAYGSTSRPISVTTLRGPGGSVSIAQDAAARGPVSAVAPLASYTGGQRAALPEATRQQLAEETGLGRLIDRYV